MRRSQNGRVDYQRLHFDREGPGGTDTAYGGNPYDDSFGDYGEEEMLNAGSGESFDRGLSDRAYAGLYSELGRPSYGNEYQDDYDEPDGDEETGCRGSVAFSPDGYSAGQEDYIPAQVSGQRKGRKPGWRERRARKKAEKRALKRRKRKEKELARAAKIAAKEAARQEKYDRKAAKKQGKIDRKETKRQEKLDRKNAKRQRKLERKNARHPERVQHPEQEQKRQETAAVVRKGGKSQNRSVKPTAVGRSSGKHRQRKKSEAKEREKRISVQETIRYKEMSRDGICRVQDKVYSKTIQFFDINYRLVQNEEKDAIFENWCDFLNYFDSTVSVQLSFINHRSSMEEYEDFIRITPKDDDFNEERMEFARMLKRQLSKGNNGLVKKKYITFAVEAENITVARPKLGRIEADILNNFKTLGVSAFPLDGTERLRILYETFNPESTVPFRFHFDDLMVSGHSTKDYVAPTSFVFKNGKDFMMGDTYAAVSYLQIQTPELSDEMLAKFLDIDTDLVVNIHIEPVEQMKAIKLVKSKQTDVNRMKIDEQKKAVRSGYDMDIIPSDLNTYGGDIKQLLNALVSRNERMFLVTVIFLNTGKDRQSLENSIRQTTGIAVKNNCPFRRLDYLQEEGLMSSLPLGVNHIPIKRGLTTTSTAVFIPFTTQELFMGGDSLYYGLNALSNNMIMVDRKQLKNPNGLFLGTPGGGKSFMAKQEITNAYLVTEDDIMINDPEGEYSPLVNALGGQVVYLSPTSRDYINPLDINMDYSDEDNPLGVKSDFILSFFELIMGGRNNLTPEERTMVDRCIPMIYRDYFNDPQPENMPILGDLYECLMQQEGEAALRLATALELYVNGSLNVFNHRTNVELNNRVVCYDIKELGKQLKKLGMLVVQDQVWNRVTVNRSEHRYTRYYIDEFHLLLKEEQTAAFCAEIWKRFRKWSGIPTGITQNIKDLLASDEIENILDNSDFIVMLNQAAGDRQILAKQLNISRGQLEYITNSNAGEGLLFYGNTIIPFRNRWDSSSKLFSLMSTKPEDVAKRQEQEAREAAMEAKEKAKK